MILVRLKLSSFFFFCHFQHQNSSLSPHVVSPSSLSPLSLSHFTLLSLVLYLPLFSFFPVSFCPWVYRIWRCELGGILDKVFHILLAAMSKFDSPQIDSVIDDDDEFW